MHLNRPPDQLFTVLTQRHYVMCDTERERTDVLNLARHRKMPVASVTLITGGYIVIRLKQHVLHRCPKCGYRQAWAPPAKESLTTRQKT